jgi:hypothetical protein
LNAEHALSELAAVLAYGIALGQYPLEEPVARGPKVRVGRGIDQERDARAELLGQVTDWRAYDRHSALQVLDDLDRANCPLGKADLA